MESKNIIEMIESNMNNKINDHEFSIIMRKIISENLSIFLNQNTFFEIPKKLTEYPQTFKIFIKFYEKLLEINKFKKEINNFLLSIKKHKRKIIHVDNFKELIKNEKQLVNAYFDDNFGKYNFFQKIKPVNTESKYSTIFHQISNKEIFDRILGLYNYLGHSFFQKNNIKLISTSKFNDLSYENKIIYMTYLQKKVLFIFNYMFVKAIKLKNSLLYLNCLLNPLNIEIITDYTFDTDEYFSFEDQSSLTFPDF